MPTVQVAVPKTGRRTPQTIGVFVADKGIMTVQVPPGCVFGDEFEYTYETDSGPQFYKVLRVPLPGGMEPGLSFLHRCPNGKRVLVSCPPGITAGCSLLVPWSDTTNEHFLVQAQIAKDEEPKRTNSYSSAAQSNAHSRGNKTNKNTPTGFSIDDLQLAQVLSMTMLNGPSAGDSDIQKALKASLTEYGPPTTQPYMKSNVDNPTYANEDEALEMALQASLQDAKRQAAVFSGTGVNVQTTTIHPPIQSGRTKTNSVDEDEILRLVQEESLREFAANAALTQSQLMAKYNAASPIDSRTSPVTAEPYAFTKHNDKFNQEQIDMDDGFQVVHRRGNRRT